MGRYFNRFSNLIENPKRSFYVAVNEINRRWPSLVSDKLCIKAHFYLRFGRELNLKNPETFSEKLQWLKLYDRKPLYTQMVDKYEAKKYVANVIGEEFIIPTLGVWERAEDIDWESLPNQFVLKCTHDSGDLIICKDKAKLDKEDAIRKLNNGLKRNYYLIWREWPYKNVPRRIIAEKYIEPAPNLNDLPDYKFFCFNGEVKALFVATDRQKVGEDVKFDFFDADFNHLPFKQGHEHAAVTPLKPKNFEIMKKAAAQLSKGMPHARVDLYEVGNKVLFGEVTLFHFSGLVPFEPEEWDKRFGDMLTLPGERLGGVIIRVLVNGEIVISQPDLHDYKFFCFSGVVKFFKIDFDRQTNHHANYYDRQGKLLPFGEKDYLPQPEKNLEIPEELEQMMQLAETLAEGKTFLRVDFYNINGRVLFGEITFYPASGLGRFEPECYDKKLGEMIKF